jgi:phage FluMu protein Com
MAVDEKDGTVVRCPQCGSWLIRADFDGTAELNCGNNRCKAVLLVASQKGELAVVILDPKTRMKA